MRTRIALALLGCISLMSCGGGGASGTWTLDVEASTSEALKAMPAEQRKALESQIASAVKAMKLEIELKSDGSATFEMSVMGQNSKATGSWTEKGNTVTLTAKTVDGKTPEGDDKKPMELTRDGDRMTAKMGEGQGTVVLKRK